MQATTISVTAHSPAPAGTARPAALNQLIVLAAAIIAFALTRLICLSLPLERDEGEYAYIAQRWLMGDVPYRDQFNQKPPGVFAVYAATFAIFGESVEAIHAVLAGCTALTAGLLFLIQSKLTGRDAAGWTVLAFVVLSIEPAFQGPAANTEHFANLGLVLAAWAMLRLVAAPTSDIANGVPARIYSTAGLMGLACAAACAFKQVAALPVLWLVVYAAVKIARRRSASLIHVAGMVASFVFGASIIVAPVVVYFAVSQSLPHLLDGVWWHNLSYIRRQTPAAGLSAAAGALSAQMPAVGWAYVLGIAGCFCARRSYGPQDDRLGGGLSGRFLAGGWLISAIPAVGASLNFYGHYFLWLVPPLSLLVGSAAAVGVSWVSRHRAGMSLVAVFALLVGILAGPVAANLRIWLADSSAQRARLVYGQNLCAEAAELGGYIRASGGAEDRVFILGSEPQILFHAHRPSATRYIIMYPLFGPYADAEQRQREVIDAIVTRPPEWVLDVQLWSSRTPAPNAPRILEQKIAALLRTGGYRLEAIAVRRAAEQRFDLIFGEDARRLGDRALKAAEGGALLYRKVEM